MRRRVPVIARAALSDQGWNGRADILRRVEVPSVLGCWSYEPIDAKLARETKAGTILQLCLYSDLLAEAQKLTPEYMYVVVPWSEFEPQQYRFADYAGYYRKESALCSTRCSNRPPKILILIVSSIAKFAAGEKLATIAVMRTITFA